ncbi:unnamed protein product [Cylindrotheca closterium]|uniref:Uncharacterized protein n=1 Tax=Cylindrotheca closterium TaxID=2856 RepID=A0AAD2FSC4_9STRA|nr:unnamed protein product [Cylindrotheca closterium]
MSTEGELQAQRRDQTREQRPTLSRGGSVSSQSFHASLGLGSNSPTQPSTTRHCPPGHCPESLEHILVEVLDLPPDGILAQALKHAKTTCFVDLMAMTDVAIDSLVYPSSQTPNDEGNFQDDQLALVPLSICSLIKVIQGYVYYRKHVHNDPVNPDNCMDIDYGSVLGYRASGEFLTFGNRTIPQPIIQKPSRRTPADEFDRSIRREPSSSPTFSNDKQWENYNRNLAAICCTYGLQNVLNHKYRPQTVDEKDLFDRQQAFMYQVFTTTLLTNKGKQFVHEHQATFDAQKIYNQLAKAYTKRS